MTVAPIEGRVVANPPNSVTTTPTSTTVARYQGGDRTYYTWNTRTQDTQPAGWYKKLQNNTTGKIPSQAVVVSTPKSLPGFLRARPVLFWTWLATMGIITWDEWMNNRILPRPARYWGATWVWVGLGAVSMVDAMVPLANAFGIGYMTVVAYQYFNQVGQFAPGGSVSTLQEAGTSGTAKTSAKSTPGATGKAKAG